MNGDQTEEKRQQFVSESKIEPFTEMSAEPSTEPSVGSSVGSPAWLPYELQIQSTDEQSDQSPEQQAPEPLGGGVKSIPAVLKITIAAVVVIVVAFAFFWEFFYAGGQGYIAGPRKTGQRQESEETQDHSPPRNRSKVQDALSDLDWVEQAFLPINANSRPGTPVKKVNAIVIHYIGNPATTALQNRNYFANLEITQETSVSSNFIVGLDGEIIQCVPVDEVAYASNNRNGDTISIELCHPDETGEFTDETYSSAVRLTAWLCGQYGLTSKDVIRHYDVSGKICPKYYVENEEAWEAFKDSVAAAMM